jgi:hypothetical protein
VDVNAWTFESFVGLSADGKSVTAWVSRASDKVEGVTFAADGNEPPKSLGLQRKLLLRRLRLLPLRR